MTELETMQRAKMYLDKLAQGIDPITNRDVPEDSVLNNVRLARCFFYVSGVLERVIQNGGQVGSKPKVTKADFCLTPQKLASLALPAEPMRISEFTELLYAAAGADPDMRKPSVTAFTNWLMEKGFLEKVNGTDGKSHRLPTAAGNSLGISTQVYQGQYGEYRSVYYNQEALSFMLDHLTDILADKKK